ncbi:hypothetical protein E5676_scaffold232G00830 [Cucumis melo var. makuwa]|uniref:Uncharacterized protein n=1 Tax=Cucumis melo var. makuwa TaxID=1194695 RepID=A0A5D3BI52_CUCMM|nr:hypothetical protein E5676_scaffold232G00830 [Cucumis melo var. makuwa]
MRRKSLRFLIVLEGYKDSLATPLQADDALLAYAHAQYQLPIPVHPREDNLSASACDTSGSSTYTELELEASTNHMDSRLDNIEFELNRMKSSFMAEVTNDENDREKGGDKDEHIHENHDIDVDMAYQARKDPTELAIDPSTMDLLMMHMQKKMLLRMDLGIYQFTVLDASFMEYNSDI